MTTLSVRQISLSTPIVLEPKQKITDEICSYFSYNLVKSLIPTSSCSLNPKATR